MAIIHKYRKRTYNLDRSLEEQKKTADKSSVTKEEALEAMRKGNRIYHDNHETEEFIYMECDGDIYTEEGYNAGSEYGVFWREIQNWPEGWHVLPKN